MKLLILGGTGVISRSIVRLALERGFEVTAVNRGTRKIGFESAIRTIVADRNDSAGFAEKLKNVQADVVIDMISFNAAEAKQTLELFRNRVKQIIVTSSIAAYARPYQSLPIREDLEKPFSSPDFPYGKLKADLDQYLLGEMGKGGAAITIIRPSLTFGAGARNFGILRQNYNVVQRIKDGKPLVMVGETVTPWCFTYVDDLAMGYLLSCGNERTYNNHFQVLSDEMQTWGDLYGIVGELVGKKPNLCYVPSILLKEIDEKVMGHLYYEKVYCSVFSIEKFQKAVPEYRPTWRFKDGMAKVIESWEQDGLGVDKAKDALEDKICACYEAFRSSLCKLKTPAP